jgi:serine/threonine protein kinase
VSGHICLIDYGLAKQHVRHPRGAQTLVGTPDYSAPEVLQTGVYRMESKQNTGNRRQSRDSDLSRVGYGKSADWWSVGIMMYEMIKVCDTN